MVAANRHHETPTQKEVSMDPNKGLAFYNGQVFTVDDKFRVTQAILTKGRYVQAVGSSEEILHLAGPGVDRVDLNGRSLVPGFIDSHCHFLQFGWYQMAVPCMPGAVSSAGDIVRAIGVAARDTNPGVWIRGVLYDEDRLAEGRAPTRWELDQVAPDNPVLLARYCGHVSAVNSRALELAGIRQETPDPPGGRIERENGIPTGLLKEMAQAEVKRLSIPTLEEMRDGIRISSKHFLEHGVTSVHEMGGRYPQEIVVYQQELAAGGLGVRVYFTVTGGLDPDLFGNSFLRSGVYTGFGNEYLRIGPFKMFLDGSEDVATAAMREPYEGVPGEYGVLYLEPDDLKERVLEAHSRGFQVSIHAIGDKAVEECLRAFGYALETMPREDHRHRIEHATFLAPDLLEEMVRMKVIPVLQPVFMRGLGESYMNLVGRERLLSQGYWIKRLIDRGLVTPASSDSPVAPVSPLLGMGLAMTRLCGSEVISPEERTSLEETLRMYTSCGAYASFEESMKGILEPGKLADMVVLSGNLRATEPEDIPDMHVDMTVVDGKPVYRRA
jgi:predicted amidohydrolase YtcJ